MPVPGGFHIRRAGSPPEQGSVSSNTGKQVKFQLGHVALAFLYRESLYMSQAGLCQIWVLKVYIVKGWQYLTNVLMFYL